MGIFRHLRSFILMVENRLENGNEQSPFLRSRRAFVFLLQIVLIVSAAVLAFLVRFDFDLQASNYKLLPEYLLFAVSLKLICLQLFNLNRGWWRYSSVSDMITVFRAVSLAQVCLIAVQLFSVSAFFSRSIIAIDYVLTLLAIGGARMLFRLVHESGANHSPSRRRSDKKVIIIGAGDAGVSLLQHIQKTSHMNVRVVGFLDDSFSKQNIRFYGVRILGRPADLPEISKKHKVNEVYIAIPTIKKAALKTITDMCLNLKLGFKTIPSVKEIIENGYRIDQLRPVSVEDLLGREPIQLNKEKTSTEIRGSSVLITGAGGSIGSELCRQILSFNPKKLILLERSEYNLFMISNELRSRFRDQNIVSIVGDVVDQKGLDSIFSEHKPELVYHAAAHKHVHLMESSPREAIRNNVFGTRNLADAACQHQVKKFVMISTDKAVNPLNVMGYSKRMAELVVQSRAGNGTEFISVRFGNVLGSSGSAVQVFDRQIKMGGPVTVTDPRATRFFMTTPEAVELVLHAGSHGQSGEIYMLDMGKPVGIMDLANKMIQLSDPAGRREIKIEITGLRPGEKLYEEIVWEGEDFVESDIPKVFKLKNKVCTKKIDPLLENLQDRLQESSSDLAIYLKSGVNTLDNEVRSEESVKTQAKLVALQQRV